MFVSPPPLSLESSSLSGGMLQPNNACWETVVGWHGRPVVDQCLSTQDSFPHIACWPVLQTLHACPVPSPHTISLVRSSLPSVAPALYLHPTPPHTHFTADTRPRISSRFRKHNLTTARFAYRRPTRRSTRNTAGGNKKRKHGCERGQLQGYRNKWEYHKVGQHRRCGT